MEAIIDQIPVFSPEKETEVEPTDADLHDLHAELEYILSHEVDVNEVYNLPPGAVLSLQDGFLKDLCTQRLDLLRDLTNMDDAEIEHAMEDPAYYFAHIAAALIDKAGKRLIIRTGTEHGKYTRTGHVSIINPEDLKRPETLVSVTDESDHYDGPEANWQTTSWKIESNLRGNLKRPTILQVDRTNGELALTVQRFNANNAGYETIPKDHSDYNVLCQALATDLYHGNNNWDKAHDYSAYGVTYKHLNARTEYEAVPREVGRRLFAIGQMA